MTKLAITLAQLNFHLGNIDYNYKKHVNAIEEAFQLGSDLIIFPELSLTGYPPEDLLLRSEFIEKASHYLNKLAKSTKDIYCIVGHPHLEDGKLYNAASILHNGKIVCTYAKLLLPNYGVFDEKRYFNAKDQAQVVTINGINLGLIICEDAWDEGPIESSVKAGAEVIISPNASPFTVDKHEIRCATMAKRAEHNNVPIIYTNHICGQDDLIFDGGSMVISQHGELSHFAGFFDECLSTFTMEKSNNGIHIQGNTPDSLPEANSRAYDAICLGLRDYIHKNNIPGAIVGLSGGIDSALTATMAVDAIGNENVKGVYMPSRHSADISEEDAYQLAKNLGIACSTISIEPTYRAFTESLSNEFKDKQPDITEENIQARCRGTLLMALSNASGSIVLSTGNRSELAVGYCTLYGDMAGGYALLKDTPKTLVYALSNYRNTISEVIPERTIVRAPSAELAEDQTDQDTLPDYAILDDILELYLNQSLSAAQIIKQGFNANTVHDVIKLVKRSEYKRKQAAIGPRINKKSFIRDWRYPNTNGFTE